MSRLTIEIPTDIRSVIERHKEIDWEHIARRSLFEYARKVALADRLTEASALRDEDILALDRQIKADIAAKTS